MKNLIFQNKKKNQFLEEKIFNLKNEKRILNDEILNQNEKMMNLNKNLKKINFFGIENKDLKNLKISDLKKFQKKNFEIKNEIENYFFLNKNKFLKRQKNCEKNLKIELDSNTINIRNYDENLIMWLNYYNNKFK